MNPVHDGAGRGSFYGVGSSRATGNNTSGLWSGGTRLVGGAGRLSAADGGYGSAVASAWSARQRW